MVARKPTMKEKSVTVLARPAGASMVSSVSSPAYGGTPSWTPIRTA